MELRIFLSGAQIYLSGALNVFVYWSFDIFLSGAKMFTYLKLDILLS